MNTRLSTPSTISSVVSASSAIHSSELSRNSIAPTDRPGSQQPRPDDQTPAHRHIDQQHEYRSRTHDLGASGQIVVIRTITLDHRLDRGLVQFRHPPQPRADDTKQQDR